VRRPTPARIAAGCVLVLAALRVRLRPASLPPTILTRRGKTNVA